MSPRARSGCPRVDGFVLHDPHDAEGALLALLGDGIGSKIPTIKKRWNGPRKPRTPKPEKLTPQQIAERFLEKVRRQ